MIFIVDNRCSIHHLVIRLLLSKKSILCVIFRADIRQIFIWFYIEFNAPSVRFFLLTFYRIPVIVMLQTTYHLPYLFFEMCFTSDLSIVSLSNCKLNMIMADQIQKILTELPSFQTNIFLGYFYCL